MKPSLNFGIVTPKLYEFGSVSICKHSNICFIALIWGLNDLCQLNYMTLNFGNHLILPGNKSSWSVPESHTSGHACPTVDRSAHSS